MNEREFVNEVKKNATFLFKNLEQTQEIIQFGIAAGSSLDGFYYCFNTQEYFEENNASIDKWHMPEWKSDIGDITIDHFSSKYEFEIWNNTWNTLYEKLVSYIEKSDSIELDESTISLREEEIENIREEKREQAINKGWDLLCQALLEMKQDGIFSKMEKNFILLLETLDSYIDLEDTKRLYKLLGKIKLTQMYSEQANSEHLNTLFLEESIDFINNL